MENARNNPKAQEHHNSFPDPFATGMTPPNARAFLSHLNVFDCSKVSDGASACLVASEDYAKERGLPILARIRAVAVAGCAPETMGMGPVAASRKALERAGLKAGDLDVIELNEAFASQALACADELGLDWDKINLDGGALALGHPLGATGARITGKAAQILKREGKQFALSSQCIGGGQGIATILEAA